MVPNKTSAVTEKSGKLLFQNYCAGCHINGGNIIRRSRTLKISALKRRGIDSPEAIAKITREGIGIMSGYEEDLGEDGVQLVAKWIWDEAQNAWTQG
ncbi:c-type cytochrome [Prochlorococcus sp. MIT 1341]|uniref:c-type cytochrome n=1 Tax=Prochlorococcus sp. MIT 1341 TaxID=3096221 RepID=UPI002A75D5EB|nr:c-type cytochrome [Prochlorococcus sp. MIT 1341]